MKTFIASTLVHCAVVISVALLMVKPLRLQWLTACSLGLAATALISFVAYFRGNLSKRNFFAGVAASALVFTFAFSVFDWVAGSMPAARLDLASFILYWVSPISKEVLLLLVTPMSFMMGSSLLGYSLARLARGHHRYL